MSKPFDRSINTAPERTRLAHGGGRASPSIAARATASLLGWALGARIGPHAAGSSTELRARLRTSLRTGLRRGTVPRRGPEVPPGFLLTHRPRRSSAAAEARSGLPGPPPPAPAARPLLQSQHLFTFENLQGKDSNNPEETPSLFWPDKELR